jgi:hypothetical protein
MPRAIWKPPFLLCATLIRVLANESAKPTYRVPFNRYLKRDWNWLFGDLSHGSIVAVVNVVNCWPAEEVEVYLRSWARRFPEDRKRVEEELAFGDYSSGRYAWQLELICDLSPFGRLVRGYQGLWNVPADVELHLFAACAGIGIYLTPNTRPQLTYKEAA